MESTPLKIYHYDLCPSSISLLSFLKLANIPFEAIHVDISKKEHTTPEHAKINPIQQIPLLIEGETFSLTEANTIMRYLAQTRCGESNWYSRDIKKAAEIDRIMDWSHTSQPILVDFFMALSVRDYKLSPDEARNELKKVLNPLENHFLNNQDYITGENMTIGDLALIPHLMRLRIVGYKFTDFPKVDAYIKKLEEDSVIGGEAAKWVASLQDEVNKRKIQYSKEDAKKKKMD